VPLKCLLAPVRSYQPLLLIRPFLFVRPLSHPLLPLAPANAPAVLLEHAKQRIDSRPGTIFQIATPSSLRPAGRYMSYRWPGTLTFPFATISLERRRLEKLWPTTSWHLPGTGSSYCSQSGRSTLYHILYCYLCWPPVRYHSYQLLFPLRQANLLTTRRWYPRFDRPRW
jgi:hypothetical protein